MAKVDECTNFLVNGKCDKWIRDHFKFGKHSELENHTGETVFEKADVICSECPNFDDEGTQKLLSGTHQLFM